MWYILFIANIACMIINAVEGDWGFFVFSTLMAAIIFGIIEFDDQERKYW